MKTSVPKKVIIQDFKFNNSFPEELVDAYLIRKHINFSDCDLSHTKFADIPTIRNFNFEGSNFLFSEFTRTVFVNCSFRNCNLVKTTWKGSLAVECDFSGCQFQSSTFDFLQLYACNLTKAEFQDSKGHFWVLESDLTDASFEKSSLQNSLFLKSTLTGMEIQGWANVEKNIFHNCIDTPNIIKQKSQQEVLEYRKNNFATKSKESIKTSDIVLNINNNALREVISELDEFQF